MKVRQRTGQNSPTVLESNYIWPQSSTAKSPYKQQKFRLNYFSTTKTYIPQNHILNETNQKLSYQNIYKLQQKELNLIKKKLEYTSLQELEIELAQYKEECNRLTKIIEYDLENNQGQTDIKFGSKLAYIKQLEEANGSMKMQIQTLSAENIKLKKYKDFIQQKLERTEGVLQDIKYTNLNKTLGREHFSQNKEEVHQSNLNQVRQQIKNYYSKIKRFINLEQRIRQKDNKIGQLKKSLQQVQREAKNNETQLQFTDGGKIQNSMACLFYKVKCQLIQMNLTIQDFCDDLMLEKGLSTQINIFTIKQNFTRSRYSFKDISEEQTQQFLDYLSDDQQVLKKSDVVDKIKKQITPYDDLLPYLVSTNKQRMNAKLTEMIKTIMEQFRNQREDISNRLSSLPKMDATNILYVLRNIETTLTPPQKQLYEYALLLDTYPHFSEISIAQVFNPFKSFILRMGLNLAEKLFILL